MSLKIEPRRTISWQMLYLTPPLAVLLTVLTGFILFVFMGYPPFKALMSFFVSPLLTFYGLSELGVKAAPLIMIAVGLAIGFRANVWNIGAEGQLTLGALAGGGVALATWGQGAEAEDEQRAMLSMASIAIAQGEYYYDGDEPLTERLFHQSWRARMRRVNLAHTTGYPCAEQSAHCDALFELHQHSFEGALVH
jgi:hypothetical protein